MYSTHVSKHQGPTSTGVPSAGGMAENTGMLPFKTKGGSATLGRGCAGIPSEFSFLNESGNWRSECLLYPWWTWFVLFNSQCQMSVNDECPEVLAWGLPPWEEPNKSCAASRGNQRLGGRRGQKGLSAHGRFLFCHQCEEARSVTKNAAPYLECYIGECRIIFSSWQWHQCLEKLWVEIERTEFPLVEGNAV